ncbi:hypothetical protein CHARACLAT_033527 [Characodon lateralis]|uniref:Uncharacterized protein n=1 Tax=Characodon lateralis TaxID=208331 RepID=A0ABU7DWC0_9TELE|nr:hypothetical protein [Characodon lateralis]
MGPAEWSKTQSQKKVRTFLCCYTLLSTSTTMVKTYSSLTWLRAYLLEIPILSTDPVRIPERTYVCE